MKLRQRHGVEFDMLSKSGERRSGARPESRCTSVLDSNIERSIGERQQSSMVSLGVTIRRSADGEYLGKSDYRLEKDRTRIEIGGPCLNNY